MYFGVGCTPVGLYNPRGVSCGLAKRRPDSLNSPLAPGGPSANITDKTNPRHCTIRHCALHTDLLGKREVFLHPIGGQMKDDSNAVKMLKIKQIKIWLKLHFFY